MSAKTVTPEHVVGALLLEVQRRYPSAHMDVLWGHDVQVYLVDPTAAYTCQVLAPSLAAALQTLLSQ